jgi:uncharacterized Zn-finger protein
MVLISLRKAVKIAPFDQSGVGFVTHQTDATNPALNTASTEKTYQVHTEDLPLSCPAPDQKLWDAHPRVFLPIEESGEASCPYCGTHYTLVD